MRRPARAILLALPLALPLALTLALTLAAPAFAQQANAPSPSNGVRFTIKQEIVFDAQELLADVREMVARAATLNAQGKAAP